MRLPGTPGCNSTQCSTHRGQLPPLNQTVISANFGSYKKVIAKQHQVFAENIIYQPAAPEILAELCKKKPPTTSEVLPDWLCREIWHTELKKNAIGGCYRLSCVQWTNNILF